MVRVAMEHFEFKTNERLKIITCDGLKYIQDCASKAGTTYQGPLIFIRPGDRDMIS